jgi:hypothetical protein
MPSVSEKQRKFFGAVMGAKKGQKGISKKAKEVANEMPKKEIKKFLKKKKGAPKKAASGKVLATDSFDIRNEIYKLL